MMKGKTMEIAAYSRSYSAGLLQAPKEHVAR